MKKIVLLFLISANFIVAQKVVRKTILNPNIQAITIDAENCFKIDLSTSNSEELVVQAHIDGEYEKDLVLNLEEDGSNILVNAGFSPNFISPNDKLSAHKVVSIALEILIPKSRKVQVNGASCNVFATGDYEKLKITLNDGSCTLKNVSEEVFVLTQSGDINVQSKSAEIKALSKFGKIEKNDIPVGNNYYSLETTTGNINLIRTD